MTKNTLCKSKEFVENLKILDGVITYNGFDIDESLPFKDRWYAYTEDILQIKYGEEFTLDVGWYPESDPEGSFTVEAISDGDWENPLSEIRCRTVDELKKAIEETAILIDKARKDNKFYSK